METDEHRNFFDGELEIGDPFILYRNAAAIGQAQQLFMGRFVFVRSW
jgi:hypothetical protein